MPRPPTISEESFDEITACASVTTLVAMLQNMIRQAPGASLRRARFSAWTQVRDIALKQMWKYEDKPTERDSAETTPNLPIE